MQFQHPKPYLLLPYETPPLVRLSLKYALIRDPDVTRNILLGMAWAYEDTEHYDEARLTRFFLKRYLYGNNHDSQ